MGNYHDWSEKDFDWKGLSKAEDIIRFWFKLARIGCHSKEKYGTLRVTPYFFDGTIHTLMYPGFVYCQYNFLRSQRWYLDIYFWPKFFKYTGLGYLIYYCQIPFYTLAYYIAMKKYPHIAEEICVDASRPELIIGGKAIHNKYWTPGI